MNKIVWNFERRGSTQSAVGDYMPGKILQSRRLDPIDIITREGGQNTLNQPIDENFIKPVNVEIKLIELTGKYLDEYLKELRWDILKNHIESCANRSKQSELSRNLKRSLKEMKDTKSLYILNIEDSNSFGLTGPEGDMEASQKPNFFNLCKANFFTAENPDPRRGGSYGVGKSIFWICSKLSTVLFSSLVDKTDSNPSGLRIFGRTELATHSIKKKSYKGTGFFGVGSFEKEEGYSYEASRSVWNNHEIARKLYLDRDKNKGTGATISIVGLKENIYGESLEGHEILIGLKNKFEKFFWPALIPSRKKLNLSFVYQRNSKIRNDYDHLFKVDLAKWQKFIDAYEVKKNDVVKIANTSNSLAKRDLNLKIPPRIMTKEEKEKNKIQTNTPFEFSIQRGDQSSSNDDEANKIALIRGFGMVVDYYKPSATSISNTLPYFGVIKVGHLLGSSNSNEVSETFFRDLEPALHDRWDAKTKGLDTKYKNVRKTVEEFYEKIDEGLIEMLGEEEIESKKGPELLAGMLNLGFKGKKDSDYIISSENIKAVPTEKFKWNVSGTIRISDFPNSKEKSKQKNKKNLWSVGFGFSIKEETSRGDKIPFSKITFIENDNVTLIEKNNGAKVDVADTKSFSFEGEINLENLVEKVDTKLLAINFFTSNN